MAKKLTHNGVKVEITEQDEFGTKFRITNRDGKQFHFRFNEKLLDDSVLIYGVNTISFHFGVSGEFKITDTHESGAVHGVKATTKLL